MFTVKSNKWYRRFWPPERKRVAALQALINYYAQQEDMKRKLNDIMLDMVIYGKSNSIQQGRLRTVRYDKEGHGQ